MTKAITLLIKLIACAFGLIIWSTVGMAIWLAKVARVVAAYSFKAALQAFKAQDMAPMERSVQTALSFWTDGVKRILKILDNTAPSSQVQEISWGKVLPGLAQDILYTLFLLLISLTLIIFTRGRSIESAVLSLFGFSEPTQLKSTPSVKVDTGTNLSVAPRASSERTDPKWLTEARKNPISPALGIAGIKIGYDLNDVRTRLGEPDESRLNGEKSSDSPTTWYWYRNMKTQFGILVGAQGRVERLLLFDGDFGKGRSLPTFQNSGLGNSESQIRANLGPPLRKRPVSYPPCESAAGKQSASKLEFNNIDFVICDGKDATIAVLVTR